MGCHSLLEKGAHSTQAWHKEVQHGSGGAERAKLSGKSWVSGLIARSDKSSHLEDSCKDGQWKMALTKFATNTGRCHSKYCQADLNRYDRSGDDMRAFVG